VRGAFAERAFAESDSRTKAIIFKMPTEGKMFGYMRVPGQQRRVKALSALFALIMGSVATAALAAGGYHLLQKVPVSGEGVWDYITVDSVNRRVYLSHGDETDVLDADSGAPVGKIPIPKMPPKSLNMGVHHAAVVPELGRGFTANGSTATVTMFNLKTLETIKVIDVTGKDPNCIIYDAATKRVFTFNNGDASNGGKAGDAANNATAIDPREGKVVGTIDLGGHPEFATSDGKGHLFVNLSDKDVVLQIDSRKMLAGERWPVPPCQGQFLNTMAIDKKNERLFIGCRNGVMAIMNATNGHVITTVPISKAPDQAAFDPGTGLAFSANGQGDVTVIKEETPEKFSVLETVTTEPGARTIAVDPKTHKLFLSNADRDPAPPKTAENPFGRSYHAVNFRVLILGM